MSLGLRWLKKIGEPIFILTTDATRQNIGINSGKLKNIINISNLVADKLNKSLPKITIDQDKEKKVD